MRDFDKALRYHQIPEHMHEGIHRYLNEGVLFSDFLEAVFRNQLVHFYIYADDVNVKAVKTYADFLYNCVPGDCWGSVEKVRAWVKHEGLKGLEVGGETPKDDQAS